MCGIANLHLGQVVSLAVCVTVFNWLLVIQSDLGKTCQNAVSQDAAAIIDRGGHSLIYVG